MDPIIRNRRNILYRILSGLGIGTLTALFIVNERTGSFKLSELISVFFNYVLFSKRIRNVFFISLISTGIVRLFANITNRLTLTFLQIFGVFLDEMQLSVTTFRPSNIISMVTLPRTTTLLKRMIDPCRVR